MAVKKERKRTLDIMDSLEKHVERLGITEDKMSELFSNEENLTKAFKFFQGMKDPRQKGKVKYPLHSIIIIAILTVCSMGKGFFTTMAQYAKANRWQLNRLGLLPDVNSVPSHDTFRRIFMNLDPYEIQEKLITPTLDFLKDMASDLGIISIRLDGKIMNATGRKKDDSGKETIKNTNMVNFFLDGLYLCLLSAPVRGKSNEIPLVKAMLELDQFRNPYQFFTFDALHSQKETCQLIDEMGSYYAAPVKRNQGTLYELVEDLFESGNYGGRITKAEKDKRVFEFTPFSEKWNHQGFDSAKIIVKMTSYVRDKDNPLVMYFISNTMEKELVMEAIIFRWDIEGGLHQDKDSDFIGEDRFRCTDRMAQTNIVTINNFIAGMARWLMAFKKGMTLIESKMYIKNHPLEILNIILGMVMGCL